MIAGHVGLPTCAASWRRAAAFFAANGIAVERVMTDNAFEYGTSRDFTAALADTGVRPHVRIRPFRPQQRQDRAVQPDPRA